MTPSPEALRDWNVRRAHESYQAAAEALVTAEIEVRPGDEIWSLAKIAHEKHAAWQRELAK